MATAPSPPALQTRPFLKVISVPLSTPVSEEETPWELGGGPYEGAWDGGWHTLVITAQVRGEGDEVAAGPGAGKGTRWAVGALGPFLPFTDVSQVHGAQLPRSHREETAASRSELQ